MSHQSWLRGRTVVYNPNSAAPSLKKSKNLFLKIPQVILSFVWRVIKKIALFIGLAILLLSVIGMWSAVKMNHKSLPSLPDSMVLTLHLDQGFPEKNATTQLLSLIQMDQAPLTLEDIVDSIDQAAKDNRVKVLAFKASGGGYILNQLQALRDAVVRFKAAGKKSVIFSESYGEGGYGLGIYYLATAFDEIWMQPVGNLAIGGINMQVPFFKDVMDKYGVEAQFFQRKEYKNAMEHLTANHMSDPSRESMESLLADMAAQLVEPIKVARPEIAGIFDSLLDQGYHTDKVALKVGLIDKLNYEDVMLQAIRNKFKGVEFVSVETYSAVSHRQKLEETFLSEESGIKIAVIPIEGMIVSGTAKSSPLGDKFAGAEDIVAAIEDAANDKSIQSIVLRINSPGGSPTASETIHRAIVWAKTIKKKQIIVSMGSLAASGGYWVATPADKIYAMNATLTGSIGVVGGKINLQGIWNKLGIKWETVKYGDNSGMMSLNTPFSQGEQKQFEASLDNIYDYFMTRVAEGRKLSPAQVEKIAKGRAYTGRQALALGLVDEIGGMNNVLDDLAKANGLSSRDHLNIVYLPMMDDPMELFLMMLSEKIGMTPVLEKVSAALAPFLGIGLGHPAQMVYDPRVIQ